MKNWYSLIMILVLYACGTENKPRINQKTDSSFIQTIIESKPIPIENNDVVRPKKIEYPIFSDTIRQNEGISVEYKLYQSNWDSEDSVLVEEMYPKEKEYPLKILSMLSYHGDELPEETFDIFWYGISNSSEPRIERIVFLEKRVHDPMVDEEGDTTGIELLIENNDNSFISFISGDVTLSEGPIENIKLSRDFISPRDTIFIKYGGQSYSIYATGSKFLGQTEPEWFILSNYRLWIQSENKSPTLLMASPYFDDTMPYITFLGDLDGDNALDIILENSNHYNVSKPTLYLSSLADSNEVVKCVAMHVSVGC